MRTTVAERLAEVIEELVRETVGTVKADEVEGLDDFVQEEIANADGPEVDDIQGLDSAIEDKVGDAWRDHLRDIDWSDELGDTVRDAVREELDEGDFANRLDSAIEDKVAAAVAKEVANLRETIQAEVKATMVKAFEAFLNAAIPTAQPVVNNDGLTL